MGAVLSWGEYDINDSQQRNETHINLGSKLMWMARQQRYTQVRVHPMKVSWLDVITALFHNNSYVKQLYEHRISTNQLSFRHIVISTFRIFSTSLA